MAEEHKTVQDMEGQTPNIVKDDDVFPFYAKAKIMKTYEEFFLRDAPERKPTAVPIGLG
jgi:hypothetical protein